MHKVPHVIRLMSVNCESFCQAENRCQAYNIRILSSLNQAKIVSKTLTTKTLLYMTVI